MNTKTMAICTTLFYYIQQSAKKNILLFLLILCKIAFSQNQQDFGIISQLNVQKKFANGLSISAATRLQWRENATEFGRYFGDIGVGYSITPKWEVEGGFRFIQNKRQNNIFADESRFYASISYETEINNKISLSLRSKIQRSYFNLDRQDYNAPTDTRLRNRIQINYQYNWYSIFYASIEAFTPLDKTLRFPINQLRSYLGYQYRITRNHRVGAYYRYQQPIWDYPSTTRHILGLEYTFRL